MYAVSFAVKTEENNMGKCCICKKEIDTETAPILFMGGAGNPRCLCDECDARIMEATTGKDYDGIIDSCRELGKTLESADSNDIKVIVTVGELIKKAKERAELIKSGEYDFALDEADAENGEPEFEITEDIAESEEDKLLDEKEAKVNRVVDNIITWVMGLAIVAAVVFFVIKFVL